MSVSSSDGQNAMRTALESLLRNKHLDLILLFTVALGFLAMLIMSATSA